MKIELDNSALERRRISAYARGSITIADESYRSSIIVTTERVVEDCLPEQARDLGESHIETLIELKPEVVLFGTGRRVAFPPDEACQLLYLRQIGFEIMDTGAACRSFNFLSGEGRRIAAALFMVD